MPINLAASGVKFVLFRRQVTTLAPLSPPLSSLSLSLSLFPFAHLLGGFLLQIVPLLRPLKAMLSGSSPTFSPWGL